MNAAEYLERKIPSTPFLFILHAGEYRYSDELSAYFDRENPANLYQQILSAQNGARAVDGYLIQYGYKDVIANSVDYDALGDGFTPQERYIFLPGETKVFFDAEIERKDEKLIQSTFPSVRNNDQPLAIIGEAKGRSGNAYPIHAGDINVSTTNGAYSILMSDGNNIEGFILL